MEFNKREVFGMQTTEPVRTLEALKLLEDLQLEVGGWRDFGTGMLIESSIAFCNEEGMIWLTRKTLQIL